MAQSSKPIIGAQGEYVTEPKHGTVLWVADLWRGRSVKTKFSLGNFRHKRSVKVGNAYATREAAEMALIRAKCLRRLKCIDGCVSAAIAPIQTDSYFYVYFDSPTQGGHIPDICYTTSKKAREAFDTITPAETAAFLYTYQPEEKEDE